ncbi:MAG: hypothetical protein MR570_03515, partial [Bifidobacterium pseudolongum]|nr:hypothetical protein [Bifidobacterium pseudolongum]
LTMSSKTLVKRFINVWNSHITQKSSDILLSVKCQRTLAGGCYPAMARREKAIAGLTSAVP